MSTELVKKTFQALYKDEALDMLTTLDEFNVLLSQPPPEKWIKLNPYANNAKYLPIDKVEFLLTKIFKNWRVEILREGQLFNAVYVTVRLHYFHPLLNIWEFQDGTGAKQIQVKAGGSLADLSNVNNAAVEMALPNAETLATKDASHKLGRIFGSDLNRKDIVPIEVDAGLQDRKAKKYADEKKRVEALIKDGQEVSQEIKDQYGII